MTGLTWHWFRFVWRGHGGAMAWLLVGSALTAAMHAGFAWLWKTVLDAAQGGELTRAALTCLAVGVAQSVLYVSVQGTRTRVNERIQQTARRRVLAAVAAAEPGALATWRTGDLVTRLTDDVSTEKFAWFLCSGVFRAYEALLIVVACVIGMVLLDPVLTLWSIAPLPLLVISQIVAGRELGRRADAVQQAVSRVGGVVQDVFDGVRVVQARGLGPLARRAFSKAAAGQVDAEVNNARLAHYHMVEFGYGWQVALAALLFAGGLRVMDGALGVGDFVAFNGFVMTLVFPMFDFGSFVVRFRQASASMARLQALVGLPPAAPAPRGDSAILALPAVLHTSHLRLDLGLPLSVHPGQLLAITGPVGAGKSTLLAALAGQVRLAGEPIELPAPAWVPQDPVILSVTVGENILLGGGERGGAGWTDLLAAACLTDDVGRWPTGLQTPVGERGVTLSGGQQQRVQLARALAAELPVLLLDDATSALDADTEARFWDNLDRPRIAVVVVTHRPATLARADIVLYLREGRAEARGTHATLVATHEAYRAAYGSPEDSSYESEPTDVPVSASTIAP
ncbi:MAG: ABC transporter ATP-binding protein [Pseudomonadota bacterium]|nr:ABC transporter ATP-binding protein [Pseudomonadota bacterium]